MTEQPHQKISTKSCVEKDYVVKDYVEKDYVVKRCVVIGKPIHHSLSPLIHTLGYQFLGMTDQYSFEAEEVSESDLSAWIKWARESSTRGISCTMPHKQAVIPFLDELDPIAQEIGAVNTVINQNGRLIGYNTDGMGALRALERRLKKKQSLKSASQHSTSPKTFKELDSPLKDKQVAILGAGGASRALIYAMLGAGAQVTVFNRDQQRAQDLALAFSIHIESLDHLEKIKNFDVIIQATSVGMGYQTQESLLQEEWLHDQQILLETIYQPHETLTVQRARSCGVEVILGIEMLLEQAYEQFLLYTGLPAPQLLIKREIERHLGYQFSKGWPEPLICGVVLGSSLAQFLTNLEVAQLDHPIVELRIDSLKHLDLEKLIEGLSIIKTRLIRPAILTYRRHDDQASSIQKQQAILQAGIDLGIGLVDIDLKEISDLEVNLKNTRLILSFHDYQSTPSLSCLRLLIDKMSTHQPFLYKMATQVNDQHELSQLMQLLNECSQQLIVVAMGELFATSRAIFPLFGSYLTFAMLEDSLKSALGQKNIAEYQAIYQMLQI